MRHREIVGLEWALRAANPWPKPRLKGVRQRGMAYENAIAKALPAAKRGLWVKFRDANGEGYCCPDFVLKLGGRVVILESKLTDCPSAYTQLSRLYIPVFQHLLGTDDVRGVVIARNLTPASKTPAYTLEGALAGTGLVHWIGGIPLIP
jgi:hypothetical protein